MATPEQVLAFAKSEAERQGVPVDLVQNIVKAESGGDINAVSPKGAVGPMQLMPATAKDLGVNPNNWQQNVQGGVKYIGQMLAQFDDPRLAVAAYNAGPGNVQKHGGVPPFKETQNYVNKVVGMAEPKDEWSTVSGIQGASVAKDDWTPVQGIGGAAATQQAQPPTFLGDVQTGVTQAIKGGTPTANAVVGGIDIISSLINKGLTAAGLNVGPNSAQTELNRRAAESAAQPKRTIGETLSAVKDVAVNRPGLLLGSLAVPDPTSVFLPAKIAGATEKALTTAGAAPRIAERAGQVAGAAGTGVTQAALGQVGAPNADQFLTEAGLSVATAPLAAVGGARTPKPVAPLTPEQQALSAAVAQGIKVPPSQLTGGPVAATLESLVGKKAMASQASDANREIVSNQAKQVLGLKPTDELTSGNFDKFRDTQGKAYDMLRGETYVVDPSYNNTLTSKLDELKVNRSDSAIAQAKEIKKYTGDMYLTGDELVANIKQLRKDGSANIRKSFDDPIKGDVGRTQLFLAEQLEGLADRNLSQVGRPNDLATFRSARQNIAKSHTLEDAFNAVTQEVSAKKIGSKMAADKLVPSEMKTAGAASQFAPGYFAPSSQTGAAGGLTGAEGLSSMAALMTGRPDLAAVIAARNVGRSAMLSGPVQRALTPTGPIVGPVRPSARPAISPYLMTAPFQPVTSGLFDYMNK